MHFLHIGLLFLFFWAGVVEAQELPFEIEVEDLNIGGSSNQLRIVSANGGFYHTTSNNCLYYGSGEDSEMRQLDCSDNLDYYTLQTDRGLYKVTYDVDDNLYRLIMFDSENRLHEIIKSNDQISEPRAFASGLIITKVGDQYISIDRSGEITTLLADLTIPDRAAFVASRIFDDVALLKTSRGVYVTDGTLDGTVFILDRIGRGSRNARIGDYLYFTVNNAVYVYDIGSAAPAKLIYEVSGPTTTYLLDGLEAVGEYVVFVVREGGESGIFMRANQDGAERIRIGEGGPFCKVWDLYFNGTQFGYNNGDVLFAEGGYGDGDGAIVTDGTDHGTHVLIGDSAGRPLANKVQYFAPLQDSTVAIFYSEFRTDLGTVYIYDLKNSKLSKVHGTIEEGDHIWNVAETEDNYYFYTSAGSYQYVKAKREVFKLDKKLSPSYFEKAKDARFHYRIKSAGRRGEGMMSFSNTGGDVRLFDLPAPFDHNHSIEDLFEAGGRAYAISLESTKKTHHLFRMGEGGVSASYVGELPMGAENTDFEAFYGGETDEFYLYIDDQFYEYTSGGVKLLGDVNTYRAPDEYLGKIGGFPAFYDRADLLLPELDRCVGPCGFGLGVPTRYSPFVLVGDNAYVVRFARADEEIPASVGLYRAGVKDEDSLAMVHQHTVEASFVPSEMLTAKIGASIFYIVPEGKDGSTKMLWYSYNVNSGQDNRVSDLLDYSYAGGGAVTKENILYFVSQTESGRKLIAYSPDGGVMFSQALAEGEDFVKVLITQSQSYALTSRRIIDLESLSATFTLQDGRTFEQMRELGNELFVEISDSTGLGFYSLNLSRNQLVPIATGYDFSGQTRRDESHAIVGNNILFRGVKGQQYAFELYNADTKALFHLGYLSIDELIPGRGPFAIAYQGEFFYVFRDPDLGLELHHFRPPYTHTLTGTVRDQEGRPIAGRRVEVVGSDGLSSFTDSLGNYTLFLDAEAEYTVRASADDCYEVSEAFALTTDEGADTEHRHDFTVDNTGAASALAPYLTSATARCGFTVPFWLTVTNDGCQPQSGTATLELHPEAELIESAIAPATSEGGTYSWAYDELSPGQHYQVKLQLKMPDETLAGQEIPMLVHTLTTDAAGGEVRDSFHYDDVLRCAIDPNDKRVWPSRPEETMSNYTQLDEALTYMIRFQNTGNDTAFTVRLEDKLSTDLDWNTFRPLTSSHDHRVTLGEGGNLEVLYENILLPDSTTNEPESHGYFTFEIMPREGLADFTAIENTAGIYFDFNKPVITNTVSSTMVEVLDADEDGYFFYQDCDDTNAAINPRMVDVPGNGIDDDCDGVVDGTTSVPTFEGSLLQLSPNPTTGRLIVLLDDLNMRCTYSIIDARGRRVRQGNFRGQTELMLGALPAGVYVLRLGDGLNRGVTRRIVKQ